MQISRPIMLIGTLAIAGAIGWFTWNREANTTEHTASAPHVTVKVPTSLSAAATDGRTAFNENCASCHGANAAGSDLGPPLIHKIYEPSHHADISFLMAVQRGTRQHHWQFGDMPPQPETSEQSVRSIIAYVRELQRANGIR